MVPVETTLSNGETTSRTGKTTTTISKIGDRQTQIGKIRNPTGISNETTILRNLAKNTATIATSSDTYSHNAGFVHNNINLQPYRIPNTQRRTSQLHNL